MSQCSQKSRNSAQWRMCE